MNPFLRTLPGEALRDLRQTWRQLVVADLTARVLGFVILAPVVGLLLKLFLATTPTGVVTDAGIVTFLLHPTGLITLITIGSVLVAIRFAEMGQLMVIGFGCLEGRRVTWLDALGYVFRHGMNLLQFAGLAVVRLLFLTLPFLAAIGGMVLLLLRTYDINYYLVEKPPVFFGVAIASAFLLTVMTGLILIRVAGWLLGLPMVLFEGRTGREAMRASVTATSVYRRRLAVGLLAWIFGAGLLFAAVTFLVSLLTAPLIPRDISNLGGLMIGLGAAVVVSGLANLAVSMFTTVLFPLCVVRLYRSLGGQGKLKPKIGAAVASPNGARRRIPGKLILLAEAAAVLGVAVIGYFALRNLQGEDTALIIAHRGGAAVAPENTLAAFRRGIADGADWLELDVQEDADGAVVVVHDRDFMRVAGSTLEVWKATHSELEDLDVGSFFRAEFSDQRVPTLPEVLQVATDQAGLFIELKYYGHDHDLEGKVVERVEASGMTSNVVIMSLEYEGLRKMAALRPGWTYGLLNAVALGDLTRLEVDFVALTADAASFQMIRRAHRRGLKVYAWTINDPVQMTVMMSRGVDGIITDRVALARQVKEMRAQLTPLGRFLVWIAGETGVLRGIEKSSARDDA